jgi:hypothetical protein
VIGLKGNPPDLGRAAQRLLVPRAACQPAESKVLERDHGRWVRRSLWRTQACAGWWDWRHLRQVWLVRIEKFPRQTSPRPHRVPAEVEDHDYLTHLPGQRLEGQRILDVLRGHWGLENHGVRTLDRDWQEERAWCTTGAATDVLGRLRVWAYHLVGLLKSRCWRAPRDRAVPLASLVAWVERVRGWGRGRRDVRRVVPARVG